MSPYSNKIIIPILMLIILPAVVFATTEISMKTSDVYTAQYRTTNVDSDVLKNCVPTFQSDLKDQPWVDIKPAIFDMAPGETKDIVIILNNPPVGYYSDIFQIRCERYLEGEFQNIVEIISPTDQPQFHILVKESGEGMSYQIIPMKSFEFLANGGETKIADFRIANTGTTDLDVVFVVPPEYQSTINFNPSKTTIDVNEVKTFKINVEVPDQFTPFIANISIGIGDFQDIFIVSGQKESEVAGAAAVTSVVFGDVDAGPIKIPAWIVISVIVAGVIYISRYKSE